MSASGTKLDHPAFHIEAFGLVILQSSILNIFFPLSASYSCPGGEEWRVVRQSFLVLQYSRVDTVGSILYDDLEKTDKAYV